ncbi:MAG: sugar phosphate nucleotidyltransferase [Pedobacter sp.]|uniref:sugar phosphate nucleotidyltransferase n=1 Tax=Pedobacter sp. TaxID=1411316 RepID=UPI00356AAB9C
MQTIILCGGLGTRLYPITETIPKSLIEINHIPFIHHQLTLLRQQGITDIVLCLGKFGHMIEDYVKKHFPDMKIRYSYDGDVLLGTGGSIKKASNLLQDEFMIIYGDSYLDTPIIPLINQFHAHNKPMLMTIYHNNNVGDRSNISFQNGNIIYDKKNPTPDMEYIDYGLTIVKKTIFDNYTWRFNLSDVMSDYINNNEVSIFESVTTFHEIGSFAGIQEFELFLKQ